MMERQSMEARARDMRSTCFEFTAADAINKHLPREVVPPQDCENHEFSVSYLRCILRYVGENGSLEGRVRKTLKFLRVRPAYIALREIDEALGRARSYNDPILRDLAENHPPTREDQLYTVALVQNAMVFILGERYMPSGPYNYNRDGSITGVGRHPARFA